MLSIQRQLKQSSRGGKEINQSILFTRTQALIEVCAMMRMVQDTVNVSASGESSKASERG